MVPSPKTPTFGLAATQLPTLTLITNNTTCMPDPKYRILTLGTSCDYHVCGSYCMSRCTCSTYDVMWEAIIWDWYDGDKRTDVEIPS